MRQLLGYLLGGDEMRVIVVLYQIAVVGSLKDFQSAETTKAKGLHFVRSVVLRVEEINISQLRLCEFLSTSGERDIQVHRLLPPISGGVFVVFKVMWFIEFGGG